LDQKEDTMGNQEQEIPLVRTESNLDPKEGNLEDPKEHKARGLDRNKEEAFLDFRDMDKKATDMKEPGSPSFQKEKPKI